MTGSLPQRLRPLLAAALLSVVVAGCGRTQQSFPETWAHQARSEPARALGGMVATTDEVASRVARDVLRRGGNAVDAAVAAAFALAVVHPAAGNIGGGGFMMLRSADSEVHALDFREKAPAAASHDMYLDATGELTNASRRGHLASGVPGSVMGMWVAHERFGSLPWNELVDPAIELAEGMTVGARLAGSIRSSRGSLAEYDGSRATFLPDGRPPEQGETFRQPDLARTLERIRDLGPEGFYGGRTADLIVAEMERGGGIITHDDLAAYTAEWREPITFRYRDHPVHSMPPSSSGGATLALMAHMLEPYDLSSMGWHSSQMIHVLAETWKRAYADRNQLLADPDYVDIPLDRLLSPDYARERASGISLSAATPSAEIGAGMALIESPQTTHYSIVDPEGAAVAVTTTLNSSFGSKVTVSGAGFLLNNEMDDFSARPGFPNQFGLVQGEQNAIEPGKRMLSAMTPTIVETPAGELFFVTGTPGGSTIITTVFQTIVNVVEFGMGVVEAVDAPRVHHQHLPDQIRYEEGGLPPALVDSLRAMGHAVRERGGISGDVQAILVLEDGTRLGYADPRRGGAALGF